MRADKAAKKLGDPLRAGATFDNFRRRQRTKERCRLSDSRVHGNMTYGFNVSLLSRAPPRAKLSPRGDDFLFVFLVALLRYTSRADPSIARNRLTADIRASSPSRVDRSEG